MKAITFDQFVKDYNLKNNTNYGFIQTDTLNIENIIFDIYDCDDFELNFDDETIELY